MARPKKSRRKATQPSPSTVSIIDINNKDSIIVSSPPPPPSLPPPLTEQSYKYPDPEDDPFSLLESISESNPDLGLESREVLPTNTGPNSIREEPVGSIKVIWTYTMEEGLFTTLLDKIRTGKRADSGFKQEAWVDALGVVQSRAPLSMRPLLTIEKLKNKESNFKALYRDRKWLLGQSGFGVHPDT
jgi:Myb/SANT-like DNA-binding domain